MHEWLTVVCNSSGEKQYKFEEILPHYKEASNDTDCGTFADFVEAFKTFDREGQGLIASGEVRHVVTMLGKRYEIKHFQKWFLFRNRMICVY